MSVVELARHEAVESAGLAIDHHGQRQGNGCLTPVSDVPVVRVAHMFEDHGCHVQRLCFALGMFLGERRPWQQDPDCEQQAYQ